MGDYLFTNKAVDDLAEIWDYSFDKWSEKQADKYYNELIYSCNMLAENPKIGKKYDEIDFGILGFLTKKHLIFYRIVSETQIEIIRILSGNVDLKNRFQE